jgi:hypothetical protein
LYNRALSWFKSYYKNPTDVLKETDAANGIITGIHRYKLTKDVAGSKKGDPTVKNDAGMGSYTIKLMVKDNKYKYEITKINWKQPSYYPIEKWTDKTAQHYDAVFESYLAQTDVFMKKLVEDLKTGMSQPAAKKKSDW